MRLLRTLLCILTLAVLSAVSQTAPKPTEWVEITGALGLSLPAVDPAPDDIAQCQASRYSLDYARRRLLPRLGGSIAVGDFDNDGNADLFFALPGGADRLFRGSEGAFVDVTAKAGVIKSGGSLSAAFADFDHSGSQSLFVVGLDGVTLYRNLGNGKFADVSEQAGLKHSPGELDSSVALADIDGDGFLDLAVAAYTDLKSPPSKPTFVFPNEFRGAVSHLYRNQGDGTFKEITRESGIADNPGRARQVIFADVNGDRRPDLLLFRDNKPPVIYVNQGGCKFADQTGSVGEDIWDYAFFHAQTADFERNGNAGLALWSAVGLRALINDGHGKFASSRISPAVRLRSAPFGFHGLAADLNGDGSEDLLARDSDGKWRFLAQHSGRFDEQPIAVPAPVMDSVFVTAVKLDKPGPVLIAIGPDGKVSVLKRADIGN